MISGGAVRPGVAPRAWPGGRRVSRTHRPSGSDEAGLLGERDERQRRDQAAGRVLPADERLEPDDPVGREVDQRLVVEAQLAALDRAPQVVLEVDPLERLVATSTARTGRGAATGRALARTIAISASRSSSSGRRPARPPEAIPSDALMNQSRPPSANGARSSAAIRSAIRVRLVGVGDRVEEDPELVATEARDGVARSQAARPGAGRRRTSSRSPTAWPTLSLMTLNRSRSSRMTAIGSGVVGRGRGQRVRDPVGQQLAVGQAGRRVVQRAALRVVDQPRVVEGDRGELGEARQGIDLARARTAGRCVPDARPITPTTSSRPRSAARRRPPRTCRSARSRDALGVQAS